MLPRRIVKQLVNFEKKWQDQRWRKRWSFSMQRLQWWNKWASKKINPHRDCKVVDLFTRYTFLYKLSSLYADSKEWQKKFLKGSIPGFALIFENVEDWSIKGRNRRAFLSRRDGDSIESFRFEATTVSIS
jgi:hypothetical protein